MSDLFAAVNSLSWSKPARRNKRRARPMGRQSKRHLRLGKLLIGLATVVGTLAALLALFPRLAISNESALDPNDPFSTPFRIVNDGYVPLFAVRFFLFVSDAKNSAGGGIRATTFMDSKFSIPIFWPSDAYDYYAGNDIGHQIGGGATMEFTHPWASADITIIVQYHPFAIPFNRRRAVRFITESGPDNKLHWMQRPNPN